MPNKSAITVLVALIIFMVALILGLLMLDQHQTQLIHDLIINGTDPLHARCAIQRC